MPLSILSPYTQDRFCPLEHRVLAVCNWQNLEEVLHRIVFRKLLALFYDPTKEVFFSEINLHHAAEACWS
jgi:hypothetical protein